MLRKYTGFHMNCYNHEMFKDYLDESEFNAVIYQAERITEKLYSRKMTADNLGIEKSKIFLTFLSVSLVSLFLVFLTLAILHENREFEYSSYGLVAAGLTIFTFLTLYECFRNSKNNIFRFKEVLKEHLDELCELQCEIFKSGGVEWKFDSQNFQIECRPMLEIRIAEQRKRRQARQSVGRKSILFG